MSSSRPIDKQIINFNDTATSSGESNILYTQPASSAGTLTGLRWDMGVLAQGAAATVLRWALVIVREGESSLALNSTNLGKLYPRAENVLAFGVKNFAGSTLANGAIEYQFTGSTKTMRKLKAGDTLVIVTRAFNTDVILQGGFQFFIKQ